MRPNDCAVPALVCWRSPRLTDLFFRAQNQTCQTDAQADIILGDLEELERGLVGVKSQVAQAQRINEEGERLTQQICEIFS